jgi:uncharacterized protein (DUF2141 family)
MKTLLYIVLSLALASCASRIAPAGGEKDSSGPKVLAANPDSGSIRFNTDRIELEFDEFIELKDGGTGILFSPPLSQPVDYLVRKKNLRIKWNENLLPQTTYTLVIGKSVCDITEANPMSEYRYVFSTGDFLDSLKLSGSVRDAFSNLPLKDIVVALYESDADTVPQKLLPRYFTRSKESGDFGIENIKQGTYSLLAFEDKNNDLKLQIPDERIAFKSGVLSLDSVNNKAGVLRVFAQEPDSIRLTDKKIDKPGKISIQYSGTPETWAVIPDKGMDATQLFYTLQPGSDSLTLWYPAQPQDTLRFFSEVTYKGTQKRDTVELVYKTGGGRAKNKKTPLDTTFQIRVDEKGGKINPNGTLRFNWNIPVKQELIKAPRIFCNNDTFLLQNPVWDASRLSATFTLPQCGGPFSVLAERGTFYDFTGRPNDSLRKDLSFFTDEDLGNLLLTVTPEAVQQKSYILELLDDKGKALQQQQFSEARTFEFNRLVPGNYAFRLIEDADGDKKWSRGNWKLKKQPESVIYFKDKIEVRAGWDLELEWLMEF